MSVTVSPELNVARITKRFGLRTIFSNITFQLGAGDALAITGSNGSGKSTLVKVLANVAERTEGSVEWRLQGTALPDEGLPQHLGFVAPYLQLYTEFTAWEHVEMVQKLRGLPMEPQKGKELFQQFGLLGREHELLRTFSSGMLQRVKFICALVHSPPFLILDEPATNLDEQGIQAMRQMIADGAPHRITIIATNDADDLTMCSLRLGLE
ncbi:MAG: ABC transporter ATP-binding protein [Armatimonadetes bacterium]|nr:ABC transporter ATP-binding protein [Armatimonadota bacterium]